MYYPGTPDAAQASKIVVKQGEEIPSIEMLMRQVPVHRIRGRVYNQITHKPGVGTTVILSAKITGHEWQYGNQDIDVQKQDGSFEIPEVVLGSYVLIGFWFDEGKVYSTTMPLEVANADVEGVAIAIAPGVNISGQIIWEGKASLERDELSVTPRLAESPVVFQVGTRVAPRQFLYVEGYRGWKLSRRSLRPVQGLLPQGYSIRTVRRAGRWVHGFEGQPRQPGNYDQFTRRATTRNRIRRGRFAGCRCVGRSRAERTASISSPIVQIADDRSIWAL